MGRHLNIEAKLAVAAIAALFALGANTNLPAQTRNHSAQLHPAISLNTPLARDAKTFELDKGLEAQCRKMGTPSPICLCVIHILKYELTLSEYQIAARLYGQPKNRKTLYQTLKSEGFKPSEIHMAEEMERSLTKDEDFDMRCQEAKAYYKTSRN